MPRIPSPAKINLWLRIEGRRPDGYHELTSLVLPLEWGDWLEIEPTDEGEDRLECEDTRVPLDSSNLILRAADIFRRETGILRYHRYRLEKNIPPGGGFGGGSGNAVAVLQFLNLLFDNPLSEEELHRMASSLGSDCPLFLYGEPCVIRGRGEMVEIHPRVREQLASYRILLFDPGFSVSTAWAFAQWSDRFGRKADSAAGKGKRKSKLPWEKNPKFDPDSWIGNDLGDILREKYLFYDALFSQVEPLEGVHPGITGSGSGCFFLCEGTGAVDSLRGTLQDWWPDSRTQKVSPFLIETGLLPRQSEDKHGLRT